MKKKTLSQREKDFCICYAQCGNSYEAAVKAGYVKNPAKEGERLLCRSDISDEIAFLEKQLEQTMGCLAKTGYQRLAFGNIADAVSLLYMDKPSKEELEKMDLFSVSEIKKPKDGAMEIKFFDKLKALEKLEILSTGKDKEINPFYEALKAGVDILSEGDSENED